MQNTRTHTGKLYFVSGISGGREAFLGKAIDEPYEGYLSLEGKTIAITPQGVLTIRPFATLINFPIHDPICTIQQVHLTEVREEAKAVLESSIAQISAVTRPLLYSWMESCLVRDNIGATITPMMDVVGRNRPGMINPLFGFFEGFMSSAEHFRRALFETPQVDTTAELDKMTELEGDLTIEIGKITNQIAIKLNQILGREKELTRYLAAVQQAEAALAAPTDTMGGWVVLIHRIQLAKNWARRIGNTALVREINLLTKTAINDLNETILEHCSSLDMLITEAFAQYGIASEIYGELSPFKGYVTPFTPARTYGTAGAAIAATQAPPAAVGRP